MRDRKDSDSPSNYDREIRPKHTVREHAEHLHGEAARMDPRIAPPRPVGPLADAIRAITDRLGVMQRAEAANGTSLLLKDPRDLAAVVERLACAGQLEGLVVTWETIGAYALAGVVAASRAAEVKVDTGDAA